MAIIALATGLLVAALAPAAYLVSAGMALRTSAAATAQEIAVDVAAFAVTDPLLWQYNVPKIVLATGAHERSLHVSAIEVLDCSGAVLVSSVELGFSGELAAVVFAPVITPLGVVATIGVAPNLGPSRGIALRLGLIGLVVGTFTGLGLYWVPTRVVRRQYRELRGAASKLQTAQRELRETNLGLERSVSEAVTQVRALSARAEQVQETERARVARELHDTLGQNISALRLELDALERDGDLKIRVPRLRNLSESQVEDLRRAIRDLRPAELDHQSLVRAIEELAEDLEVRSGLAISVGLPNLEGLSGPLAASLFRVVQEGLTNVIRHASASEVGIRATLSNAQLILTIRDDGQGGAHVETGHGLSFMEDRLAAHDGVLELSSTPDGTKLSIRLPLRDP
ncbi:MAG: signal transduction histidine kinase [Bradymonadia bacterium]|jgi:signal transduction histidine kinase